MNRAATFDGYPRGGAGPGRRGAHGRLRGLLALAGVLLITFVVPLVAKFALRSGPAEFVAVFFLTFCSLVGMG